MKKDKVIPKKTPVERYVAVHKEMEAARAKGIVGQEKTMDQYLTELDEIWMRDMTWEDHQAVEKILGPRSW